MIFKVETNIGEQLDRVIGIELSKKLPQHIEIINVQVLKKTFSDAEIFVAYKEIPEPLTETEMMIIKYGR